MAAKARALVQLVQAGDRSPLSRRVLTRELQVIAEREALTSRGLDAVLCAIDALEALGTGRRRDVDGGELEWPSRHPHRRVRRGGYWPYRVGDPQHGSGMEEADLVDTEGVRDRWRASLKGPPPWRRSE